jgi:uncharacterized damage-inducible protein DinB
MTADQGQQLLDTALDAWDRGNRALVNLLQAIPPNALAARALPGSPTVAALFAHLHHERMISVLENVPEWAGRVPETEWNGDLDAPTLSGFLMESASRVRDAVKSRIEANRNLDRDFAHPIQLVQFLIFHEGYHHGQIKLALKAVGCPVEDAMAGPLMWDVWRAR